jgi:hypothetical protein
MAVTNDEGHKAYLSGAEYSTVLRFESPSRFDGIVRSLVNNILAMNCGKILFGSIFLSCLSLIFCSGKTITLTASYTVIQEFNETSTYRQFFREQDAVLKTLSVNPGLVSIEKLSPTVYRGELSPIHSPGLSTYQTIDFHIFSNLTTLMITVPNDAMKLTYKGLPFMTGLYSKLAPSNVRSLEILAIDKYGKNSLSVEATLEVDMVLPSWFPFPAYVIEKAGSESIQKKVSSDVNTFIGNVVNVIRDYKKNHGSKSFFSFANKENSLQSIMKRFVEAFQTEEE